LNIRRFIHRFLIALVTFAAGSGVAAMWLRFQVLPTGEPHGVNASPGLTNKEEHLKQEANPCEWQRRIASVLPEVSDEFEKMEAAPSVKELVAVDAQIRQFFNDRPDIYPCEGDAKHYQPKYAKMGVHLGYWNDLVYTGKLLVDAHRMNPKSAYRKHTLFSTIMGDRTAHGLGEMPDIAAAFRYFREFPDGPFAEETSMIIADFHKDLLMVLRDDLHDYKYDCFKPYITATPRSGQMKRARTVAVAHYERVLDGNPSNARARKSLDEISDGTINSWSFCAD
jgi:hypothetical protein